MTDHKAKVEELLHFEDRTSNASLARDAVQVAQVHATLYLAEQQRIANLIALGLTGPEARRQIVEGLGL